MISFIFGLVLLIIPFLAVASFKDKKVGFVFVLFFSIVLHVALAILTQSVGIFYYGVIIGITLVADLILLFFVFKSHSLQPTSYKLQPNKIDWALMFVIIVGFLTLLQVHYNYTGKINLATDRQVSYHEVRNMQYVYPYFSDEWYSVALITSSINNHALPIANPYDNSFFPNLELFFHSFLAEIILILNLNPLTQYTLLSIFFNLLIIVLVYLLLRINNLSKNICAISALSVLYITCGANMPGLWNLIPFNMGIILCLIMYIFVSIKNSKMVIVSSVLGSLFYPPLFIFYFLGLVSAFFEKYKHLFVQVSKKEILLKVLGCFVLIIFVIAPAIYLILLASPFSGVINYGISRIFFVSFTAPYVPEYLIYNIILSPVILLAIFGISYIFKNKKWLLFQFLLGGMMWSRYSQTLSRFMIEYERIVILTAIIISIITGFALFEIKKYLIFKKINPKYIKFTEIFILVLFLVFIPLYTQRESWRNLVLIEPQSKLLGFPKAPANNYLTQEDLKIFKNIENAKFLSIPWKGTVIGTATNNYPVVTKEGTISMGKEDLINIFFDEDCVGKKNIAESLKIDYVYLYDFTCPGFEKIDQSKEGLILYKILY
jgi:hypothetical protein